MLTKQEELLAEQRIEISWGQPEAKQLSEKQTKNYAQIYLLSLKPNILHILHWHLISSPFLDYLTLYFFFPVYKLGPILNQLHFQKLE